MLSYIIALGANLDGPFGTPLNTLKMCIKKLQENEVIIEKKSSWYKSQAFPNPLDPPFVNRCLKVLTYLEPSEFLDLILNIETELGRNRKKRWESRVCDIDILSNNQNILPNLNNFNYWYKMGLKNQLVLKPNCLIIPHPRIQDRDFVLVPFCEIDENWKHPIFEKEIRFILEDFKKKNHIKVKKMF